MTAATRWPNVASPSVTTPPGVTSVRPIDAFCRQGSAGSPAARPYAGRGVGRERHRVVRLDRLRDVQHLLRDADLPEGERDARADQHVRDVRAGVLLPAARRLAA